MADKNRRPGDAVLGPGILLVLIGAGIGVFAPQALPFAALLFVLGVVLALVGRAVSARAGRDRVSG